MKNMKKTAAVLLLISMLTTSLLSCSESETNADQTEPAETTGSATPESAGETEPEETEDYLTTHFQGIDYGGADFKLLTREQGTSLFYSPNFDHEDITGEPVRDATYNQFVTVEEKLGVAIDYEPVGDPNMIVLNAVASGDDTYKAVIHYITSLPNIVTQNALLDMNNLDQINFDNPWWNKSYKEKLTIGGKFYLAFGDLFFEAGINNIHLLLLNKDMCDDYSIEYPYQAVYDGKWTMDYLMKMVEGTAKDLNGDGKMDDQDQWGLVQSPIQSSIMYYTSGFNTMSFDEEGYPYLDMYSEKMVQFYEKLYQLDYKTPEIWTNTQAQEAANFQLFAEGRALLSSHFLTETAKLREVEYEVGILPYPKYEEEAEYINWPMGVNFLMGVPSVVNPEDYTFIGHVLEALAAQGYQFVRPALYEVTLQGKLARDPESQDMLDILFDTMSVDFGWIHDNSLGMGWFINGCLNSKLENITSYYNRVQGRSAKYYEEIVNFYRTMD